MSARIDRLSSLLQRFELHARVFHSGALCGVADFDGGDGVGHLHLVRRGPVGITDRHGQRTVVSEPSVLFYPRPMLHRIDAGVADQADVVCAAIEFGVGDENPLLRGLPDLLLVPLTELPGMDATLGLLFQEALGQRCGHSAVVDRLTEVLVVQLLRHAMERRMVSSGLIAGLADPRLARALVAMHAQPDRGWTLETLAVEAGMSRSRFAAHFSAAVGIPAMEYLTAWRIGIAKGLLRRGGQPKAVAQEVGYGRSSAFGRAFAKLVGMPPSSWLRTVEGELRQ